MLSRQKIRRTGCRSSLLFFSGKHSTDVALGPDGTQCHQCSCRGRGCASRRAPIPVSVAVELSTVRSSANVQSPGDVVYGSSSSIRAGRHSRSTGTRPNTLAEARWAHNFLRTRHCQGEGLASQRRPLELLHKAAAVLGVEDIMRLLSDISI